MLSKLQKYSSENKGLFNLKSESTLVLFANKKLSINFASQIRIRAQ